MIDAEAFLAEVGTLCERTALEPLHAALLLAVAEGVAEDTRAFSKRLGVAHALSLRAATDLDGEYLRVVERNSRTQRARLALTNAGRAAVSGGMERLAA